MVRSVRNVEKSGGNKGIISEVTGGATNLGPYSISHWGSKNTFDSKHLPNSHFDDPNHNEDDNSILDYYESSDKENSDDDSIPAKAIDGPIDLDM